MCSDEKTRSNVVLVVLLLTTDGANANVVLFPVSLFIAKRPRGEEGECKQEKIGRIFAMYICVVQSCAESLFPVRRQPTFARRFRFSLVDAFCFVAGFCFVSLILQTSPYISFLLM